MVNLYFLYLEACRVKNAFQFDPLYAISVSQIDPLPHQIDAVYHYILPNLDIRFLLADDHGAGKTIMAGLLFKELKYRGLIERALIVVPCHPQRPVAKKRQGNRWMMYMNFF